MVSFLHNGPVFLVGLMGAGKTTLGRLIAQELNLPFYDTDEEIEQRAGADIPWIFDVEGESGFRERETHVLEDLAREGAAIVSTGGGIVTRAENRKVLSASGYVIYLYADAAKLYSRIGRDKKRPLLQECDPLARLEQLLKQRDPYYREVADHIVCADDSAPKDVSKRLANFLAG